MFKGNNIFLHIFNNLPAPLSLTWMLTEPGEPCFSIIAVTLALMIGESPNNSFIPCNIVINTVSFFLVIL